LFSFIITIVFVNLSYAKLIGNFTLTLKTEKQFTTSIAYLLYQADGEKFIDSASNHLNQYVFTGMVDHPHYATVIIDHKNLGLQAILSKKPKNLVYYQIILHPGSIVLSTTRKEDHIKVLKSTLNSDFLNYQNMIQPIQSDRKRIETILLSSNEKLERHKAGLALEQLKYREMDSIVSFINK